MIKLLSKLSISGGIVTGACLVNFSLENMRVTSDKKEIKKIKASVDNIDSLEAIELFEKAHGCSFAFVDGWDSKSVYTIRKFLKKVKAENKVHGSWEGNAIHGANLQLAKEDCKTNGIVALFNGESGFWPDKTRLKAQ